MVTVSAFWTLVLREDKFLGPGMHTLAGQFKDHRDQTLASRWSLPVSGITFLIQYYLEMRA